MSWTNILSFFDNTIPIWDVGITIGIVALFIKLGHLKELLSNHVTDTNKKIDKLENSLESFKTEVRDKFDKILDRLPKKP